MAKVKSMRALVHKVLRERGSKRLLHARGIDDITPYLPNRPRRTWVRILGFTGMEVRASKGERKLSRRLPRRAQKQALKKAMQYDLELTASYMKALEKHGKGWWT